MDGNGYILSVQRTHDCLNINDCMSILVALKAIASNEYGDISITGSCQVKNLVLRMVMIMAMSRVIISVKQMGLLQVKKQAMRVPYLVARLFKQAMTKLFLR